MYNGYLYYLHIIAAQYPVNGASMVGISKYKRVLSLGYHATVQSARDIYNKITRWR